LFLSTHLQHKAVRVLDNETGFFSKASILGARLGRPNLQPATGCGAIKGGRHVICPKGTPLTNLQYTMLLKLGIPLERFSGSQGEIGELSQLS
jgi:hypothetical protein